MNLVKMYKDQDVVGLTKVLQHKYVEAFKSAVNNKVREFKLNTIEQRYKQEQDK